MNVSNVGKQCKRKPRFLDGFLRGTGQRNRPRLLGYPDAVESIDEKMSDASDDGTGVLHLEIESGKTVFDALQAAAEAADIEISYQQSSYGVYVNGIGGIYAGGSAGWMYSVNGAIPMVGAGSYVLTDGDAIQWVCVNY